MPREHFASRWLSPRSTTGPTAGRVRLATIVALRYSFVNSVLVMFSGFPSTPFDADRFARRRTGRNIAKEHQRRRKIETSAFDRLSLNCQISLSVDLGSFEEQPKFFHGPSAFGQDRRERRSRRSPRGVMSRVWTWATVQPTRSRASAREHSVGLPDCEGVNLRDVFIAFRWIANHRPCVQIELGPPLRAHEASPDKINPFHAPHMMDTGPARINYRVQHTPLARYSAVSSVLPTSGATRFPETSVGTAADTGRRNLQPRYVRQSRPLR